jgi:hypothetical protein
VLELKYLGPGDALDEPNASFVKFFDALDHVDPVLGAPTELFDYVKPSAFARAPARGRTGQLPADVVEGVPSQIPIGDHAPVEDGAVEMGEHSRAASPASRPPTADDQW